MQPLTFTHYSHFLKFFTISWRELAGVGTGIVILLLMAAPAVDFNNRRLDRAISNDFPVNAINYLRQNPVPGPLYNNLNWGGFLMWFLPELPVSIDGRNDLYGDKLDELFLRYTIGVSVVYNRPLFGSGWSGGAGFHTSSPRF